MVSEIENAQIEAQAEGVSPEVMDEFQGLMDDLATKQRDPNIPEGTTIGTGSIEGMPATWKKQASLHHINGQALPERIPLYQYPTNEVSMIPTALVFKRLARVDNGHRTWSRAPFDDGIEVAYIEKEVPLLEGGTMTKKFRSEAAYETFMKGKHGDTWESMLRDEERAERAADRAEQRSLAQALLAAAGGATPQVETKPALPLTMIDHLDNEGLKALADEFKIELSDRRSPEKMRAELKAALEVSND